MSELVRCPQCPWMGMDYDLYIDNGEKCCPRCGVPMSSPKTFTPLTNLILFGFSLNKKYLNTGTQYELDDIHDEIKRGGRRKGGK